MNTRRIEEQLDAFADAGEEDRFEELADEVYVFPGDGPVPDGGVHYFSEKHGVTLVWHDKKPTSGFVNGKKKS